MKMIMLVDKDFDKLAPGDVLECDVAGHPEQKNYVLCCGNCGKAVGLPHTVDVHEDKSISLWSPKGKGLYPRSFVCPLCQWHVTIDHGVASMGWLHD